MQGTDAEFVLLPLVIGAESVLVNIAHAGSTWSANERIVYLGHANGSALECAACLDVLVAKNLLKVAANE